MANGLGFDLKDPLGLYSGGTGGAAGPTGLGLAAAPSPGDKRLPAGMRNNNPGNIKFNPQNDWVGQRGPSVNTDQGDPQVVFDTPESGMRAAYKLATNKYKAGARTANQIIAGDGGWTPGNTQAAVNVAQSMGLGPDDDLNLEDPQMAGRFLRALTLQEHGPASNAYADEMIGSVIERTRAEPATDPFAIVDRRGAGGDPEGKGMARLATPASRADGPAGILNFAHKGQERIREDFRGILEDVSSQFGRPLNITSGYRSTSHPVERRKKSGGGEHTHGNAVDIDMSGMNDADRAQLVLELRARGVKRFGTYSASPNMLHVDMKDQKGDGSEWFMYDTTNKLMGKAPAWFQEVAGVDVETKTGAGGTGKPLSWDGFQLADPMGLYAGRDPLADFRPTDGTPDGMGTDGEIRIGRDGQRYQWAETTGMQGATGDRGWIRTTLGGGDGKLRPFAPGERVDNADGTYSTEVTTTWQTPDGTWINVPSLWMGPDGPVKFEPGDEKGILGTVEEYERENGPTWERFATLEEAEAAAKARSAAGGVDSSAEAAAAQLNADEPGRYKAMTADEYAAWKKDFDAKQPGQVEDAARMAGGGIVKGGSQIVRGAGAVAELFARKTITDIINPIFGTDFKPSNPLDVPADWIDQYGKKMQEGVSQATKDAIEGSTPDGDVLSPSTWTLGKNPSLRGYTALALDVFGSMTPVVAAAIATGGTGAVVTGGLQGGGAAEQQASDAIAEMAKQPGKLEQESAYFREQLASGKTRAEAVAATQQAAGQMAFLFTTPVSALGGGLTSKIINPATRIASGLGLPGRAAARIGAGAIEEGTQEVGETVATRAAQNVGAGMDESLTQGTFGDFLLGAIGGGGTAVPGALLSKGEAPETSGPENQQPDPVAENQPPVAPSTPPVAPAKPKGMLKRAVEYGQNREVAKQADRFTIDDGPIAGMPAGEGHGKSVTLAPDQSNVPANMRRVVHDDGREQLIGSRLLKPAAAPVQPAAAPIEGKAPASTPIAPSSEVAKINVPEKGATVRVEQPGMAPFMARVDGTDGEDVIVVDSEGEVLQVPATIVTPIAPPVGGPITKETRKRLHDLGYEPDAIKGMTADQAGEILRAASPDAGDVVPPIESDAGAAPPVAATVTTEPLPPRSEQRPAAEAFPGPPKAGQRVIVDAPEIGERFAGVIESWDGSEAIVKGDNGRSMQVPLDKLYVSKLTRKDVEAQDLAANPPVDRETPEPSPRLIDFKDGKSVELPDDTHAALYALGKARFGARRLGGTSQLDLDQVSPAEQRRIANELGITPAAVGQAADDYRYRVERAGATARSKLPVKMHKLDAQRLAGWRVEAQKEANISRPGTPENEEAEWWDGELSDGGRANILKAAGIKRSEKTRWGSFTPQIRTKLRGFRPDLEPDAEAIAAAVMEGNEGDPTGQGTTPTVADYAYRVAPDFDDQGALDIDADAEAIARAVLDDAAHEAATSPENNLPQPTEAQKEAGNYKLGHARLGGLDISIENPAGSTREGTSRSGKAWKVTMASHYGYIRGTVGKDKDHIDVFIKPGTAELGDDAPVFVVDQRDPARGLFDEHKVMMGFTGQADAEAAYRANYAPNWKGLKAITPTTLGAFKGWLASGDTKKPFAGTKTSSAVGDARLGDEAAQPASPATQTDVSKVDVGRNGKKSAPAPVPLYPGEDVESTARVLEVAAVAGIDPVGVDGTLDDAALARVKEAAAEFAVVPNTLDAGSQRLLDDAIAKLDLTGDQIAAIMLLSRAAAALDASDVIRRIHLAEAISYVGMRAPAKAPEALPKPAQNIRENIPADAGVTPIAPQNVPNPVNGKPLANDPKNTLVLMACAQAKIDTDHSVPFLELYNGPMWQDLRANGQAIPPRNIFALSGKHGFVSVMASAKPYEEKISAEKVDELVERGVMEGPKAKKAGTMPPGQSVYAEVARDKPYSQVIIYGAGEYRRGFNAIVTQLLQAGVIEDGAPIVATEGTILKQRQQFNEFLRAAQGKEAPAQVDRVPVNEAQKFAKIDADFAANRAVMNNFKKGDEVEWTSKDFYREPVDGSRDRIFTGTVVKISEKSQGIIHVRMDGGGDVFAAAAKLRKRTPEAPKVQPQTAKPAPAPAKRQRTIPRDTSDEAKVGAWQDFGIDEFDLGSQPGEKAADTVLRRGRKTGRENVVAVDQHGDMVGNFEGTKSNSTMTKGLWDILRTPGERVVLHHNHPEGRSFSLADYAGAFLPGMHALYAHGHDGSVYRVEIPQAVKDHIIKPEYVEGLNKSGAWMEAFQRLLAPTDKYLVKMMVAAVKAGDIDVKAADRDHHHMLATALHDAGVLFYNANRPRSVLTDIPAIADAYNQVVKAYGKLVDDTVRSKRPANPLRGAGDLEQLPSRFGSAGAEPASRVADRGSQGRPQGSGEAASRAREPEVAPAPAKAEFAKNKLFTADKVAAARARLKSKMGQLNSGLDPEMLVDGMTIAGAYIEAGVRDFADYARQMTDDFGPSIKPYLLSFWEAARNYPGLNTAGMTSVADSAEFHGKQNAELPPSEAPALGIEVKAPPRTKKKGRPEDRTLTQDWGVEHIDAYTDEGEQIKAAFMKDATAYMRAVADELQERGFVPQTDGSGRPLKAVSANPGGVAGAGYVHVTMSHPELGVNAYATTADSVLRGVAPTSPSGISLMWRTAKQPSDRFASTGQNRWAPTALTAGELAAMIAKDAERGIVKADVARPAIEAEDGKPGAPTVDQGSSGSVPRGPEDVAQPAAPRSDTGDLEAGSPGDVPAAPGGQDAGGRGVRGAAGYVGDAERPAGRGDGRDGRKGAGRGRTPDADVGDLFADRPATGAGDTGTPRVDVPVVKAPETVSPANTGPGDFYISDPMKVIGGGAVARFNRNKAAIELRNTLIDEGRNPTVEEQEQLAGYTGWGSFGQELFQGTWARPQPKAGWEARDTWLRENLGQQEWEGLQRSIINAHYTDPPTVRAMWDMVKRMGFKGGRVLEPSIGIGNFFGMMPPELTSRSQRSGIELDPVTGSMAQMLYPNSNVRIQGYEASTTPDDFYDLVIGNWPFADVVVADRRYNRISPNLHDYFFLKALDQTRPGGIVIGLTSKGTMDKKSSSIRNELAKKAELVTAFRLPTGAFEEYAGTKVITDIIVLRKRAEPKGVVADEGWIKAPDFTTPEGEKLPLNEFYHAHPENVLGEIHFGKGTTHFRPGMEVQRPADMQGALDKAVSMVPEGVFKANERPSNISYVANHTEDRTGALVDQKGTLYVVQGDQLAKANDVQKYVLKSAAETAKREQQLRDLIGMRKLYGALIDAERHGNDAEGARKALRDAFTAYRKDHGGYSKSFGLDYLRKIDDPFYPALAALETAEPNDRGGKTYRPASIMTRSTMRGKPPVENPTIADAFVIARQTTVNPTPAEIAAIAGKPESEVRAQLVESGAAFNAPNGDFVPADIYLSGNVRQKLRAAEAAFADGRPEGDPKMSFNIRALKEVIPEDIPYYKIETQMGATWVPASAYEEFIAHMLGLDSTAGIDVSFKAGAWNIEFDSALNHRPEARSGWGIDHAKVPFKKLVRNAIANQTMVVKFPKDDDGKEEIDEDTTKAANGKIAEMRQKFGEWLWSDPQRRVDLEQEYNEVRNAYATPKFDGSFLSFEGMALQLGEREFNLRKHQVDAIWRGLVTRKSLNAHEVGTGKTFTMGGIAVESRRYGIAKKPLLFGHNANSATVAHEIQQMYPGARILYVDNLSAENVKTRMMQIANDDWDVVVVPHSLIDRFGFKEETLMAMAAQDIADLELAAEEAAEEDGYTLTPAMLDDPEELKKLRSPTAKQLVKQRLRIIETIKKLSQKASKPGAIAFEDLGVDMVLVDEAHEFKKPPIATKMKMKGLQTQTSDRSIAMNFITRYIRTKNNGNNVHLFTGTPITNTMTEVFHMMRYMMLEEMEANTLADWDGWFGSFAREVEDIELSSTGDYEPVVRLQAFINVPELRRMIGQYMDVVFSDDMPEMQPRKVNGKTMADPDLSEADRAELLNGRTEGAMDRPYKQVVNDSSDMSPQQMRVFRRVQALANEWRQMGKKDRRDAMLAGDPTVPIIHDRIAESASFDVRLVNAIENAGKEGTPEMRPDPQSKPARVVKNLIEVYRSDPRATQAVFMQQGMSKSVTRSEGEVGAKTKTTYKAFSTLADMIERLVQAGIPREQIAVVDGSTSGIEKKEIAQKMNRGEVRIVFGSTQSLGVGVNMQKNLRAMHHMDAPWMPGDLEQRNGRGQRQGNQWNTVKEYRYLTDRLDGRRWQVLAIKQKFITDFMKAKGNVRVIEGDAASDEQSDILSTFSDAAGDPRILLREKNKKKIDALESRKRLHNEAQSDAIRKIRRLKEQLPTEEKELATLISSGAIEQATELLDKQRGDTFRATLLGKEFDNGAEAATFIAEELPKQMRIEQDRPIGTYGDVQIHARWDRHSTSPDVYMVLGGRGVASNGPSLRSLAAQIRHVRDEARPRLEQIVAGIKRDIATQEAVSKEDFYFEPQLRAVKKLYADIEADIAMNPVAPPYWLRSGAPVDTPVYWHGKEFTVTGQRYADDGYFVLASDDAGAVVIPYMQATDAQGMPLYQEHAFEPPKIIEKEDGKAKPTATTKAEDDDFGAGFEQSPKSIAKQLVTERRIATELKGRLTDLQPSVLAAIPFNYFTELARPAMTSVAEYLRLKRVMDAYRGKKHSAMDEVAQRWLKFAKSGKANTKALADLMHDSTLAGIDPAKPKEDGVDQAAYNALRARYTALPPAGKVLYNEVRDAYEAQAEELDRILVDNMRKAQEIATRGAEKAFNLEKAKIEASKRSPADKKRALKDAQDKYDIDKTRAAWSMKARLTKLRQAFEASRVTPPYFPLARFGRYYVTVRDVDGEIISFSKRERAADRDRLAADMRKAYPTADVTVGVMEDMSGLRGAMDPRIVAEIETILGSHGVDNDVMDQIWQRYLESMPDLSVRKRFIHRKGLPGFEGDALRSFASHMFHAAHQMARLKYGLELQELVNEVVDQARDSDDPTRGMILANEMKKRHQWVMNPTGGKVAQVMTSAAFVYFLAASPAAAVINMTQTPMLGIPILAGRFGGFAKASAAMLKASKDSIVGRGSVGRAKLSAEERAAIDAFYESGLIDRTQAHDIAGVGETGVEYTPLRAKVMKVLSYLFHRAEVWNREVTALAAYRMAKAAGQDHAKAIDTSHDLTWKTHFDYANSSRPRLMQNDLAKVALVFRSHTINILYRLFRDIRQSFKGETPQARKEARYQLAGILGMQSLFAGVTGIAGFHVMMALAGMFLGDDDDPFDFEDNFRKSMLDILGPELGGVVLNGVPGHYGGVDLTQRIGMPDLWFRSPPRDLEGRDEYEYWVMNSLGASIGMLGDLWNGATLVKDGEVARGIEAVAPKWAKDLMKSARYAGEGVQNLRGDQVVERDSLSAWNIIGQALGFTPAKVAEAYDRRAALLDAESRIYRKRADLMNEFAAAQSAGDDETLDAVLDKIDKFNAAEIHSATPITAEGLISSLRSRARNDELREDGALIENRALGDMLRERLPERVY